MGFAADLLLVLHLAFVLFVALGGLLVIRWPAAVWLHVPAAAWGAAVEAFGWICPLTPLEDDLRARAGQPVDSGDFIARTVLPLLYPEGLTREAQIVLAAAVLVGNLALYANIGGRLGGRFPLARYLWALPNTCIGLLLAVAALRGGGMRLVRGVLEVHGPLVALVLRRAVPLQGGAAAITFGHVVAGRNLQMLEATRVHERVHVAQCERWGPLFVPAYLLASVWSWVRGTGAYQGNWFERQARTHEAREFRRLCSACRRPAGVPPDGSGEGRPDPET